MKQLLWVWLMLLLLLSLSACGGKLADGMQVEIAEGSSGYSTEDIQAGFPRLHHDCPALCAGLRERGERSVG